MSRLLRDVFKNLVMRVTLSEALAPPAERFVTYLQRHLPSLDRVRLKKTVRGSYGLDGCCSLV